MSDRRVVVTGLGPITPIGLGAAAFWSGLLEGRNAVRRLTAFDPSRFDSQFGAEIDKLDVGDYVPKKYRKAGKIMARDIAIAVAAAYEAVRDSGLQTKCLLERGECDGSRLIDSTRFGANIGAGLICADLPELAEALSAAVVGDDFTLIKWGAEGMTNLTPLWLLKFLPNMLACHVTIVHDAQGPSNTITCGEASSHLAIGEAFRTIARGVADVCMCGGAESKVNPMALLRQSLGKRLSQRDGPPSEACRPLSTEACGTVVSEGGGIVILEELEHARARGARIYAELVGFGASNDAYQAPQPSLPHPEGRGLSVAVRKALRDARKLPAEIDLIAAFAPGIRTYDVVECRGLRAVLGERTTQVPVLSIHGGLGNNGAGAGAIQFIAAVLSLYHNTVPTSLNCQPVDESLGVRVVAKGPIDQRIGAAVCNAYALSGGQNASLVIQRFRE